MGQQLAQAGAAGHETPGVTEPAALADARQGHLYQHGSRRVLAMESGRTVRVREIEGDSPPWMGPAYVVNAAWLLPLPMKYFHGQVPHG